jgi:threonine/homoserine/homoserine lactone efflux protein
MRSGRRAGLQLAGGVVLGSLTWGVLAAAGLSALLVTYGNVTTYIRLTGGAYLLWLAYKSFKSALRAQVKPSRAKVSGAGASGWRFFGQGLAIHLTNSKAIVAWIAIIAIGVSPEAPYWVSFVIVGGCWLMGVMIFGGYAILFSTNRMSGIYNRARRWIETGAGLGFGAAGISLIVSQR